MPKFQIDTEDGHTYEIETEDSSVGPGPANPPIPKMTTSTAGEVLPAVRSFAAGSLRGIANLPSAIVSMMPHTETLPPIPPSVQPWHPSTYGAYQPPDPQAGLKQGIAAFRQDPAGTIGGMIPLAAMGADVDVPPVGGTTPPPSTPATKGLPNLPEIGTVGKLASHIPGIGRFIQAYDFIRGMLPNEPAAQAPEPFRPNPNIQRQFRLPSGGTPPLAPLTKGPLKTGKVTGGSVPKGQTIPSETLPSQDWRFEDARGVARLLKEHGVDPNDFEEDSHWGMAAQAYGQNLGLPNDNARQMVIQEFNKIRK